MTSLFHGPFSERGGPRQGPKPLRIKIVRALPPGQCLAPDLRSRTPSNREAGSAVGGPWQGWLAALPWGGR
eukprot:6268363-Pyramimonas_sp.AAC.1